MRVRLSRPASLQKEYDKQLAEAPKDKVEALSYWAEKSAFWMYQISNQLAGIIMRYEVRNTGAKKAEDKAAGKQFKYNYYCIEYFPAYPAVFPPENVRRTKPKDGEPFHMVRAFTAKEAKAMIESRLNTARAHDPNAMPPSVVFHGDEAGHDEEEL